MPEETPKPGNAIPDEEPEPEDTDISSETVRYLVARTTTFLALGILSVAIIGTAAQRIGEVMKTLVAFLP